MSWVDFGCKSKKKYRCADAGCEPVNGAVRVAGLQERRGANTWGERGLGKLF
jgi:hypothetical protein